ncbi:hypothetical protein ABKN59_007398 [Abortiporus biennis]
MDSDRTLLHTSCMEVTVNRKVPVGLKEGMFGSSSALVLWLVNAVRLTEKHVGGLGAGFQTRAEKTMIAAGSCLMLIGTPHINIQWDLNGIVHWFTGILIRFRIGCRTRLLAILVNLRLRYLFLFNTHVPDIFSRSVLTTSVECPRHRLRNMDTFDLSFTYLLTAETSSYYRTLRATMPTLLGLRLILVLVLLTLSCISLGLVRMDDLDISKQPQSLVCNLPRFLCRADISLKCKLRTDIRRTRLPFTGDIGRQILVGGGGMYKGTTTDVRINVVFLEMMALVRRKDTQI